MTDTYSPDLGAEPASGSLLSTAFLGQRDLGLDVPINYVTSPGVSLQAACFPHLTYGDDNCISNLLAVGFRRFELDLYWDEGRNAWSFCPVAIPSAVPNAISSTATSGLSSSSLNSLSAGRVPTTQAELQARQDTATSTTLSSLSSTAVPGIPIVSGTSTVFNASATYLGSGVPTVSLSSVPDNSEFSSLVSIGPYVCSTDINLSTFMNQILGYIEQTQNTLDAFLLYTTLNIHAAASYANPLSSTAGPTSLPGPLNSLSSLFSGNLSAYLYTPTNLANDRADLNASWYTVSARYRPIDDYYQVTKDQNNVISTEDGWPSLSYVEFSKSKRLLLGWGTTDPQMDGYNFTGDAGTIFSSNYIQDLQTDVAADSSGDLTNGCFVSITTNDLRQTNSSWAVVANISNFNYPTTPTANIVPLLNLTTNTTNCGISPMLNVTLLNTTSQENYVPYRNFTASTLWSWAHGEPRNYTTSNNLFRCATSNIDLFGRWVVADCSQKYYAACRAPSQPYNWTITSYEISYSYAAEACPTGYQFAAPRTAIENSYLTRALRSSGRDFNGHGAWVDFNSLDYQSCWVTGGPNATCPYTDTTSQYDELEKRIILVPAISAVIVLVITALTIFVKAAGNKKVRKRTRRRADNGFVYEGVPS